MNVAWFSLSPPDERVERHLRQSSALLKGGKRVETRVNLQTPLSAPLTSRSRSAARRNSNSPTRQRRSRPAALSGCRAKTVLGASLSLRRDAGSERRTNLYEIAIRNTALAEAAPAEGMVVFSKKFDPIAAPLQQHGAVPADALPEFDPQGALLGTLFER